MTSSLALASFEELLGPAAI